MAGWACEVLNGALQCPGTWGGSCARIGRALSAGRHVGCQASGSSSLWPGEPKASGSGMRTLLVLHHTLLSRQMPPYLFIPALSPTVPLLPRLDPEGHGYTTVKRWVDPVVERQMEQLIKLYVQVRVWRGRWAWAWRGLGWRGRP